MSISNKDNRFMKTSFFILFGIHTNVQGFLSRTSFVPQTLPHRHTLKRLWYDNTKPRVMNEIHIESEQTDAIDIVQKLLEKQKAEVQETERLLKRLTTKTDTNTLIAEGDDFLNDWSASRSPNLVSSILSGVNYGFVSRSEGGLFSNMSGGNIGGNIEAEYAPPPNILLLAGNAFKNNLNAIFGKYEDETPTALTKQQKILQSQLQRLTLNCTAVWERERKSTTATTTAPLVIKIPYNALCTFLDVAFDGRYVPSRFYFLETVARMPYFSYISMLHLYETLGWWRRSVDAKRIHFAEEWNEFHHLLIMESLGGDQQWWVRFFAYHAAVTYYIALVILWCLSPTLGYKFSEMLETHAVHTYSQLLDENEELLKALPATSAAVKYYSFKSQDPLFVEYQTAAMTSGIEPRRPGNNMKTMYDVISAIRDDEGDHVATMGACLDPNVAIKSPSVEAATLASVALISAFGYFLSTGDLNGVDFADINSFDVSKVLSGSEIGDVVSDVEEIVEVDGVEDSGAIVGILAGNVATTIKELFRGNLEIKTGFDNFIESTAEKGNKPSRLIPDLLETILKLFR